MSKLQKTLTGIPNFGVNRSIGPNILLNLHSGKITNTLLKHESPIKDSLDDYESTAVFIYAATDVMHTGNPIMKIRRDASPLLERDSRNKLESSLFEKNASDPPLSIAQFFDFKHKEATSAVTLGLLS